MENRCGEKSSLYRHEESREDTKTFVSSTFSFSKVRMCIVTVILSFFSHTLVFDFLYSTIVAMYFVKITLFVLAFSYLTKILREIAVVSELS